MQAATTELASSMSFVSDSAGISEEFHRELTLDASVDDDRTGESPPSDEESDGYDEEDDDDFSFWCAGNGDESPVSADDLFHNGQIRPMYPMFPMFDQSLLSSADSKVDLPRRPPVKKVFVEAKDASPPPVEGGEETFCEWSGKAVEALPEICKKSNSTGFSKLFRFRDLLNRSNSDGRDAFVFLNGSTAGSPKRESTSSEKKVGATAEGTKGKARKGGKGETSSMSAHYSRNRALREGDRRRTYLPYRPEAAAALPSCALLLVTNDGGANITNDALPPVTNDDGGSSLPFPDRDSPACCQDPRRAVPSVPPSSSTARTSTLSAHPRRPTPPWERP
ncbi:hypothetical protein RHSIM_Rhsim12G0118800 [Rhododendron simsii]|uniref:Uncharacterized protein n=1 Tax=Rhododendron simsii TaxID=118357 RepID=A0A834L933_RHOSS|nr:hypothetical protein RHSIM_Rhsim12G0118800 [Rhododendron simsii]